MKEKKTVVVEVEKLKKLVSNFDKACFICKELNVYEHPDWQELIENMKSWVKEEFEGKDLK